MGILREEVALAKEKFLYARETPGSLVWRGEKLVLGTAENIVGKMMGPWGIPLRVDAHIRVGRALVGI